MLKIGLAIAPLFPEDVLIAKLLLKTAVKSCFANKDVPNTKLELLHPAGDSCGKDSSELMDELEAEMTFIGYRMYSKGVSTPLQEESWEKSVELLLLLFTDLIIPLKIWYGTNADKYS